MNHDGSSDINILHCVLIILEYFFIKIVMTVSRSILSITSKDQNPSFFIQNINS